MPNYYPRTFLFMSLLGGLLLSSSCKQDGDLFRPKFNTDMVAPLVYGDLTVEDLLKNDTIIKRNPDKTLSISKAVEIVKDSLGYLLDFFNYDKSNILAVEQIGATLMFGIPSQTFSENIASSLDNPSIRLVDARILSGEMEIIIVNNMPFPLQDIRTNVPGMILGSTPYTNLFPTIPVGETRNALVNLAGYRFDLRGLALNSYNTMVFELISDTLLNQGFISGSNSVSYSIKLRNLVISRAQGNFGTYSTVKPVNVDFSSQNLYKNILKGGILINTAALNINIDNLSGVPFNFRMDAKSTNGVTGAEVTLTPSPDYPILKATENPLANDPANYHVVNSANGYNFANFISNLPSGLSTNIVVENTNTNPADYSNFVHRDSYVKGVYEIEIPLDLTFDEFTLKDTVKFDGSSIGGGVPTKPDDKLQFQSGQLRFRVGNGFPYDMWFTIKAYDSVTNKITTVIANNVYIKPAGVNAQNIVNQEVESQFVIPLTAALFENLQKATHVEVTAKLDNRTNTGAYKIYTDYKMAFKIIGQVKFKANL